MPHESLQIVMKAEDILKKSDFESKFEQILKLLIQMEKRNTEAIYKLQQDHSQMMNQMGQEYNGHYSELKGKVDNLFVEDKVSKMHNEMKMSISEMKKMMSEMMDKKMKDMDSHMAKMEEMKKMMHEMMGNKMKDVDDRMAKVKDGSSLTTEMLQKALTEPLTEFKKELREKVQQIGSRNRILAGPNVNALQSIEFVASGETTTFSGIPTFRSIKLVLSTQAPFIYGSNTYSIGVGSITFNSLVNPIQDGQEVTILYVK